MDFTCQIQYRPRALCLGKRTIDDHAFLARETNAHPFRAGVQSLAGEHDACLDQFFVELPHRCQQLLARQHTGLGTGLYKHHDFHRKVLPIFDRLVASFVRVTGSSNANAPFRQ
jgi:hypothetical protein